VTEVMNNLDTMNDSGTRKVAFTFSGCDTPTMKEMIDNLIVDNPEKNEAITHLRDNLTDAKTSLSSEKAEKKRLNKCLFKLANQLKHRLEEIKVKDENISLLSQTIQSLKEKVSKLTENQQKLQRDQQKEITKKLSKYRELCKEANDRIAELLEERAKESEKFRVEILQMNMEADKLRVQLAKKEIEMLDVPNRSYLDHLPKIVLFFLLSFLFFIVAKHIHPLTKATLCAPALPGTTITTSAYRFVAKYDAPWWAPAPIKKNAFKIFCSDMKQTQVQYFSKSGKFVLKNLRKKIMSRKNVKLVMLNPSSITFIYKRTNRKEVIDAPWVLKSLKL